MGAKRWVIWVVPLLLLGCGGGGSGTSSGGGATAPAPAPGGSPGDSPDSGADGGAAGNPLAGTYTGTVSFTVSGLGTSLQDSDSITVIIDVDGRVTVDGQFVGNLSGDTFLITQSGSETVDGVTCSGAITVSGSIANGAINGSFQATTLTCNGIPLDFSGGFSATKTGANLRRAGHGALWRDIDRAAGRLLRQY